MRTLPGLLLLASVLGCASSHHTESDVLPVVRMDVIEDVQPPVTPAVASTVVAEPETTSVRFLKTTVLRSEPSIDADPIGVVARDVRAGVQGEAPAGDGCQRRWIHIAPRGWACEQALEPSDEAPTPSKIASLASDASPPRVGVYGTVRGKQPVVFPSRADAAAGENGRVLTGSNTVRAAGTVTIDGRRYWRTSKGDLIDAASIRQMSPSGFRGVALVAGAPLPAWVRSRVSSRESVKTRATPTRHGRTVRTLTARAVVTPLEQVGSFVRIGDGEWIARADLRLASRSAPPPGTGDDERWFDIDRDEQVLVAYEGERAVYATLVSTGKARHETPIVITRIASKHQRATMTSNGEEVYSVADVPWTMYYDGNYALHSSYWHDGFGGRRSHGCINLSVHDAHVLYHWSSPDVPPGWTSVYGNADHPGSLVRVRSGSAPEPQFRGYARALQVATRR